MVEKMVKEDKIEAEAEVSNGSPTKANTFVFAWVRYATVVCYSIINHCPIPVRELGPHSCLLCKYEALEVPSLSLMNILTADFISFEDSVLFY